MKKSAVLFSRVDVVYGEPSRAREQTRLARFVFHLH